NHLHVHGPRREREPEGGGDKACDELGQADHRAASPWASASTAGASAAGASAAALSALGSSRPVTDWGGLMTARAASITCSAVTFAMRSGQERTSSTVWPVASAKPKMRASAEMLSRS